MLIPIIKDFNNAFSYFISTGSEKAKEISGSVPALSGAEKPGSPEQSFFEISGAIIKVGFSFLVHAVQYIVSFQWLRDFAYLPILTPANNVNSSKSLLQVPSSLSQKIWDGPNMLQRFLFSNQTGGIDRTFLGRSGLFLGNNPTKSPHLDFSKKQLSSLTESQIASHGLPISNSITGDTHNHAYPLVDFLLGSSPSGGPWHSWSLSFLSNDWFDPLTVPINFLSSQNLEQSSSLPMSVGQVGSTFFQDIDNGSISISHKIFMMILLGAATFFSSFFNSFFISFPFSLSTIISLRYLIIQKLGAGCLAVLGIVLGELAFGFLLILPPPFIQISLTYLESVWPFVLGLSLILFLIYDILANPYANSMSLSQISLESKTKSFSDSLSMSSSNTNRAVPSGSRFLWNSALKIFGIGFLLSFTEQSCFFAFFGSLNLSSTANFLDTYLFAASRSPITLLSSCTGFLIGSFLAITIYNYVVAKLLFSSISYFYRIRNRLSSGSLNGVFSFVNSPGSFINRIQTNLASGKQTPGSLLSKLFSGLFTFLGNTAKNFLILLPGARRLFFLVFPGQAKSYNRATDNSSFSSQEAWRQYNPEKIPNSSSNQARSNWSSDQVRSERSSWLSAVGHRDKTSFLSSVETSVEKHFHDYDSSPSVDSTSSRSSSPAFSRDSRNPSWTPLYNKIDKVLLTCLITLSFTTIPYYSFDHLVNSVFGFIPQDQILNSNSLRVNFPDYTNLLGITLTANKSVLNTDVSLYDRAHFMYGTWPNSFESLNYQGESMWNHLRDHRRQKRTRRSTRLKFKTLKTKISTSWKDFKRSSGFSGSMSNAGQPDSASWENKQTMDETRFNSRDELSTSRTEKPFRENSKTNVTVEPKSDSRDEGVSPMGSSFFFPLTRKTGGKQPNHDPTKTTPSETEQTPTSSSQRNLSIEANNSDNYRNSRKKRYNVSSSDFASEQDQLSSLTSQDGPKGGVSSQAYPISNQGKTNLFYKLSETRKRSNSDSGRSSSLSPFFQKKGDNPLSEIIKPLSSSTFSDLSGGEKAIIKAYPKNWKKAIMEKYYQNPIYQTLLSTDIKTFLKREPKTQQLTSNQENELYFLRIKMAHYYDSLRFYFKLKDQINGSLRPSGEDPSRSESAPSWSSEVKAKNSLTRNRTGTSLDNQSVQQPNFSLPPLPFQFKSMTSMNYRQQFKGTLRTVKQLFSISLNGADHSTSADSLSNPIENSYKYDKYLFNEHAYPKNAFYHEEAKIHKARPPLSSSPLSKSSATTEEKPLKKGSANFPRSSTKAGDRMSSLDSSIRPNEKRIRTTTKTIYNLFGANDPFYVGWDQNSRKFVLTSRILTRASALNHQVSPLPSDPKSSDSKTQTKSMNLYRPYTSWPFLKPQLKNLPNRPYLVLYENYLNLLNKRVHLFDNINSNDIDTKSLTFLYSYSLNNNVQKYVSQLPINLYKQSMRATSLENLFTPTSNARSCFLWPGSVKPAWEYYFW